jgi:hypothetical protein
MPFYYFRPDRAEQVRAALNALSEAYGGTIYAEDNLVALARNYSFWRDQKFIESFKSTVADPGERSLLWRLHTLAWAAKSVLQVPGDFVECGVLHGFCSTVICKYLDFQNVQKTYWLYDTFAGLPEETSTPQERAREQMYYTLNSDEWLAGVQARLSSFGNARIVKGVVPFSFEGASPEKIAFLHLDMNSAAAEVMALEKLFDRISPGGIIVLDDFGWVTHREQMVAELAFMTARGHSILELPTGQGMIIKR